MAKFAATFVKLRALVQGEVEKKIAPTRGQVSAVPVEKQQTKDRQDSPAVSISHCFSATGSARSMMSGRYRQPKQQFNNCKLTVLINLSAPCHGQSTLPKVCDTVRQWRAVLG